MASIATEALQAARQRGRESWARKNSADLYITVGMGTCGLAAGAADTLAAVEMELKKRNLTATIKQVGCVGMCSYEPMLEMEGRGRPRLNYGQATAEAVPGIVAAYLDGAPLTQGVIVGEAVSTLTEANGHALHSLSFVEPGTHEKIAFHQKQLRVVLSNCGLIDPEAIDDYLALEGYVGLEQALQLTPEAVIDQMIRSGLRGRGGGGFSTGTKWSLARKTQRWPKYVICNADEGDPGAFMDRSSLEGDPHSLIEGMIIAGYAIGAETGFIYCRAEYPLAIKHLNIALSQAREVGLLGDNILGSGFNFDIVVKEGAGAFVCGEETALMASIQGERGSPGRAHPIRRWLAFGANPATSTTSRAMPMRRVSSAWAPSGSRLGTRGQPRHGHFRPDRHGQHARA